MYIRKNKRRKGEVSFEDSLSFDAEGNELHLEDILGTDDDIVTKDLVHEVEKKLLYEEISKLNKRDKEIMVLRYGLYDNEDSVLYKGQTFVSRIEKKVIKRLKYLSKY